MEFTAFPDWELRLNAETVETLASSFPAPTENGFLIGSRFCFIEFELLATIAYSCPVTLVKYSIVFSNRKVLAA